MDSRTTTNITSKSDPVSSPADNTIVANSTTKSGTTTSSTSKSDLASGTADKSLTDRTQDSGSHGSTSKPALASGTADKSLTNRTQDPGSHNYVPDPYLDKLLGFCDWGNTEYADYYRHGGFHPVDLGDVLGEDGRFRVVHKLGYGGQGTVWLCRDNVSKKWRAVKIMAAHSSTADCSHMKALELFDGASPDELEANGIQLPLEHFWIEGPNGRHLCFVLPWLGPEILDVPRYYCHVPELVKDVCFRLVMALKFIHSRGLCHGDFRPANVLFRLVDGVDEWEEEAILKLLGEPVLVPVERIIGPGVPRYLVQPAEIKYTAGVCSSKIAVIDFGVSYSASQPQADGTGIPMAYASPELLFNRHDALGFHSDVWALGVTLLQVRVGMQPFDQHDEEDPLEVLECMERTVGPIQEPYRSIWRGMDGKFVNSRDENGEPLDDDSWKDESLMATVSTEDEERYRRTIFRECGSSNMLHYCMRMPNPMSLIKEEAAEITNKAAADPGRMPGWEDRKKSTPDSRPKGVQHVIPKEEVDQLFDLLLKIFRWQTAERATLDEIANHEWFGGRNWSQGHVERPREEAHDSGAIRTVWESWTFCRGWMALGLRTGASRVMAFLFWGLGEIGKTISAVVIAMRGRDA
ncbi:kinase-like domain-containing protein [Chaetomium fimeti]|uniref:EKC/KEOPS complex subunit BUD32 n=1 Tax=Chaetomium fimeti TaxID=1854472 RepID=A0AAE0HHJ8_9PEZI|nr:kinase-like domain-containing protein [Chaetomium fimeti]